MVDKRESGVLHGRSHSVGGLPPPLLTAHIATYGVHSRSTGSKAALAGQR